MSLRIKSAVLTAVVCLVVCISSVQAEELAIVIKPDAGESERFAAEQLQGYLEKITGQKVPVGAKAPEGAAAILVGGSGVAAEGKAALGEEGYTLETTDRGLVLAGGGPRGTLYAVYDFLERLGCRWYYMDPEDEIVPRLSLAAVVRVVRSGLQVKEKPDFSIRTYRLETYDLGPTGTPISAAIMKTLPQRMDWLAKNRMNIFQFGIDHNWRNCYAHWPYYRELFPEMCKRGLTISVGGHCLPMFIPREKFKEHPDWFPMVKGKRQPGGQFCTRNEEAVRFYIGNLIKFLKENPEIGHFAPWPSDCGGWCECPLCKDTPSADRWMELGHRIYKELKQAVPQVQVTHPAYGSHLAPPEKQRPLHGMTVTLCTWGRDLGVPFDDARTRKQFRDTFASWRDICKQAEVPLVLHEKYARHLGLGFHPLSLPILQEDCRWFRRQGLTGFELPCGYMGRRTKSLNLYVLARLMWNADADVAAIVDDYFTRCYGQTADVMRKAYQQVERAQPDLRYWGRNYALVLTRHKAGSQYSPEACDYVANAVKHLAEARRHVQQALDTVQEDAVRARIGRFAQSLAYIQLEWQAVGHMIEAARHVAGVDEAKDATQQAKELDAAEQALQAAKKLSDQRQQLATKSPGCGLYWDVINSGPMNVFKASQIDAWLKVVAQKRRSGFGSAQQK